MNIAKFSMGHEAIGHWLTEELSPNLHAIDTLLQAIQKIEQGQIDQHQV